MIVSYWIKERRNPQTGTYYVGVGPMTVKAAKKHERSLYGENVMHEYPTKDDYEAKLEELRQRGERVQ